jgi:hypothetical protein
MIATASQILTEDIVSVVSAYLDIEDSTSLFQVYLLHI